MSIIASSHSHCLSVPSFCLSLCHPAPLLLLFLPPHKPHPSWPPADLSCPPCISLSLSLYFTLLLPSFLPSTLSLDLASPYTHCLLACLSLSPSPSNKTAPILHDTHPGALPLPHPSSVFSLLFTQSLATCPCLALSFATVPHPLPGKNQLLPLLNAGHSSLPSLVHINY